jgi:hypothetical protein
MPDPTIKMFMVDVGAIVWPRRSAVDVNGGLVSDVLP